MSGQALAEAVRAAGGELRRRGAALIVLGASTLPPSLRHELRRRKAEVLPFARPETPSAPPEPVEAPESVFLLRVLIDRLEPVASPAALRPGVRVVDVPRAIESMLHDLEAAVAIYGESCADGGDDRLHRLAVEAAEDVERLVEQLEKLGVAVRVVAVQ